MSWRNLLLLEDAPLNEALKILNKSKFKTLFVTNSEQILLGSLSDGDIRRGLLASNDLNMKVSYFMNKETISVKLGTPYSTIRNIFSESQVRAIPVVDEQNRIQEIKFVENEPSDLTDRFIPLIMAGGEGRRMLPVTSSLPKPLVRVGEDTLIGRNLKRLASDGFKEVYISINYLGDKIKSHLGDGSDFGLKIHYVTEKSQLGTAGSISLLPKDLKSRNIIISNADLVHQISYIELCEFHLRHNPDISLACQSLEVRIPYGQIIFDEGKKVTEIIEKPSYQISIYAGISIVSSKVASAVPLNKRLDMTELISETIEQGGQVFSYENMGYWYDVGNTNSVKFLNSTLFSINDSIG